MYVGYNIISFFMQNMCLNILHKTLVKKSPWTVDLTLNSKKGGGGVGGWAYIEGSNTMHYKTCYTVQIVYITERGGVPASAGMRLTLSHEAIL